MTLGICREQARSGACQGARQQWSLDRKGLGLSASLGIIEQGSLLPRPVATCLFSELLLMGMTQPVCFPTSPQGWCLKFRHLIFRHVVLRHHNMVFKMCIHNFLILWFLLDHNVTFNLTENLQKTFSRREYLNMVGK